ncbi:MAG: patatin-like phospholipase family protein [Dehalococcoidia bacterium]|nr:patatin-like phospholipase family protein [Dehalococcoidia bacterium]
MKWKELSFEGGVATNFHIVVEPVMEMAGRNVHIPAILKGLFGRGNVADQVAKAYRKQLYGEATLQDLPRDGEGPRFVFNAANLQSGALFRFSRPYLADYRVGMVRDPETSLATAVAASSAFPPFLSPARLTFKPGQWEDSTEGADLTGGKYRTDVKLTDGGVYDNLGIETVWKKYRTVLVSDAGGKTGAQAKPPVDWLRQTRRVLDVVDNQVRSLRKRQVIDSFKANERAGTYWGIRTQIADYGLPSAWPCDPARTLQLAGVQTGLARLDRATQERLVNWGYAVSDAAMRRWVTPGADAPDRVPFPGSAI